MPPIGLAPLQASRSAESILGEADNSTFGNILRFLGRPGFAVRALLSGDFEGAAKNVAQAALDLPTGGFIDRRLSLANAFDEDGDITEHSERPEFSDLTYAWGLSRRPEYMGFGERLALDIIGGTLTDPLTFVGGAGIGRGIGAAALKGASKGVAGRSIFRALSQTKRGQGALDDAVKSLGKLEVGPRPTRPSSTPLAAAGSQGSDQAAVEALRAQSRGLGTSSAPPLLDAGRIPTETFVEPLRRLSQAAETVPAIHESRYFTAVQQAVKSGREIDAKPLQEFFEQSIIGRMLPTSTADDFTDPALKKIARLQGDEQAEAISGLARTRAAKEVRVLQERAAESVFFKALAQENPALAKQAGTLSEAFTAGDGLSEGIKALERQALIPTKGAMYWRLPLLMDEAKIIPGTQQFWSKVGRYGTAPGWVRGALKSNDLTKPLGEVIDHSGKQLWDWATITFYDRFKDPKIMGGVQEAARSANLEMWSRNREADRITRFFGERITEAEGRAIGEAWDAAQDAWKQSGGEIPIPQLRAQILDQATEAVPTLREKSDVARQLVDRVMEDFQQIPNDLVKLKVWPTAAPANPFYMPRQLTGVFRELLDQSFKNVDLKDDLADVFTKARKNQFREDFQGALEKLAAKHGVDIEGLVSQETDMVKLYRERMFAHNRTVARAKLVRKAERLGIAKDDTFQQYLRAQFEPIGMRESAFTKWLGGGTFKIPGEKFPGIKEWAKKGEDGSKFFARRVVGDTVEIEWPGLNFFWKPMLTSWPTNPAFHVRNTISAFYMMAFDPDLVGSMGKFQTIKHVWESLNDAFLVRAFGKGDYAGDEIANVIRALGENPAEAIKAREALKLSGKTVGPYAWDEVLKTLDKTLGPRLQGTGITRDDLMQRLSKSDIWGREIVNRGPKAKQAFNRMTKLGSDMAEVIETRWRAHATIELLAKGIDPDEVVQRVNRAFVDYDLQSTTERFLRDVIPFARFAMGSVRWAGDIANKPILVNWMGRARGTNEDEFLPERAEDSLALPLPWKDAEGNQQFLLGLGLPVETTLQILGAVTPEGFRQTVLGGLQPAIQLPAEAITNRDFYFGGEFGEYRKAPDWIRELGLATEVELPGGKKRYEISGNANEILSALPTSRLDSAIDKLLDQRRAGWNKLLNLTTGARTMSVDQRRELKNRLMEYLKVKADQGLVGETLIYFDRFDPEEMPEDLKVVMAKLKGLEKENRQARRGRSPLRPIGY